MLYSKNSVCALQGCCFILTFIATALFRTPVFAQAGGDESAIRSMLAKQVVQWNRGNVAGYMVGYWEHDSLVFIGKNGPTYGYRATLERYRKAYPDAAHMGQLTSTVLRLRMLSPEWAYVTGRWQLKRPAGDLGGYYTLLLRKIRGEWLIVEDHSS
jgi:ketosteroid isomerase-like protein